MTMHRGVEARVSVIGLGHRTSLHGSTSGILLQIHADRSQYCSDKVCLTSILFNCPENFQRLAMQHGVKLKTIDAVLFTHLSTPTPKKGRSMHLPNFSSIAGLCGLIYGCCLTGKSELYIRGPANIPPFVNALTDHILEHKHTERNKRAHHHHHHSPSSSSQKTPTTSNPTLGKFAKFLRIDGLFNTENPNSSPILVWHKPGILSVLAFKMNETLVEKKKAFRCIPCSLFSKRENRPHVVKEISKEKYSQQCSDNETSSSESEDSSESSESLESSDENEAQPKCAPPKCAPPKSGPPKYTPPKMPPPNIPLPKGPHPNSLPPQLPPPKPKFMHSPTLFYLCLINDTSLVLILDVPSIEFVTSGLLSSSLQFLTEWETNCPNYFDHKKKSQDVGEGFPEVSQPSAVSQSSDVSQQGRSPPELHQQEKTLPNHYLSAVIHVGSQEVVENDLYRKWYLDAKCFGKDRTKHLIVNASKTVSQLQSSMRLTKKLAMKAPRLFPKEIVFPSNDDRMQEEISKRMKLVHTSDNTTSNALDSTTRLGSTPDNALDSSPDNALDSTTRLDSTPDNVLGSTPDNALDSTTSDTSVNNNREIIHAHHGDTFVILNNFKRCHIKTDSELSLRFNKESIESTLSSKESTDKDADEEVNSKEKSSPTTNDVASFPKRMEKTNMNVTMNPVIDMNLTFLGTGSATPSKYRNNSGILLQFIEKNDNNSNSHKDDLHRNKSCTTFQRSVLLEAGEGVWCQLCWLALCQYNSHVDDINSKEGDARDQSSSHQSKPQPKVKLDLDESKVQRDRKRKLEGRN
eukprot:g282.t1